MISRVNVVTYKELISFVWQFIKKQKWIFGLIFLIDAFTWPLDALLWPYIISVVVDIFTRYEGDRLASWTALQWPIISGIVLVIYVETASRAMGYLMARAIPKLQSEIRMKMFDHIQHHSPRYFNERFAGSLANKITDMTTQVETILQELFWPILPAIATCILGSVFLWFVNPVFTWILLAWTVIHLSISLLFARRVDSYEQRHGEARTTLLGKIVDSLTNNFAVNLFYRFKYEKKRLMPYQEIEEQTNREARQYVEKMRLALSIFSS